MKHFKVTGYYLSRGQSGWSCETNFRIRTIQQFSDESHWVRSRGRYLISAMWNSWRKARERAGELSTTDEARAEKGWV